MNNQMSPDKNHVALWRWGGEMWMSGPEWGWLAVDENEEIKGVIPEDVIWSEDSQFMAFIKLHIEDVPNRQGVEGLSFRVGVMRMSDYMVRYCLGNRQLAAYYAKNPVFAVLGGISNGSWQPIHDFCEEMRLPCLFPITDFPVVSETGWYTYYFNKGYYQEGEAVARYLNRLGNLPDKAPILQIVQDSSVGKTLCNAPTSALDLDVDFPKNLQVVS